MVLNPRVADPAEAAISRLLHFEFDEAVVASGSGEAFRKALLREIAKVLLNGAHDLVEPVASVAPGTGHLVVSLRVGDGFHRALAAAAEDVHFLRTH